MGSGVLMGDDPVIEPEVLESLEAAERSSGAGAQGQPGPGQPLGCTIGPGCGCVGLPLAVVAGVVVSSLMALLWVLSLGRVPFSLAKIVQRARRGGFRG